MPCTAAAAPCSLEVEEVDDSFLDVVHMIDSILLVFQRQFQQDIEKDEDPEEVVAYPFVVSEEEEADKTCFLAAQVVEEVLASNAAFDHP